MRPTLALLLALLAAGCLGDAHDAPAATAAEAPARRSHDVRMDGFAYVPATLDARVGDEIRWRNLDAATHSVTAAQGAFSSGPVPPGASWARVFAAPGTYAIQCDAHAAMTATVRVS